MTGDGVDQSCNGQELCYIDVDNDTYKLNTGVVVSSDVDCNDSGEATNSDLGGECNDANAAINPGATEVCDGVDNDCDSAIDEGLLNTYYQDSDSDGQGNVSVTTGACSVPIGYTGNSWDCNDTVNTIYSGAAEVTGDGVDQSCNGQELCYVDSDDDTYRL